MNPQTNYKLHPSFISGVICMLRSVSDFDLFWPHRQLNNATRTIGFLHIAPRKIQIPSMTSIQCLRLELLNIFRNFQSLTSVDLEWTLTATKYTWIHCINYEVDPSLGFKVKHFTKIFIDFTNGWPQMTFGFHQFW